MREFKNRRNPILPLDIHIPECEGHVMPDDLGLRMLLVRNKSNCYKLVNGHLYDIYCFSSD